MHESQQWLAPHPDCGTLCQVSGFPQLVIVNVVLQEDRVRMLVCAVRGFTELVEAVHHVPAHLTRCLEKVSYHQNFGCFLHLHRMSHLTKWYINTDTGMMTVHAVI
eukprot:jgi/Ulvmu1/4404/UM002_0129.1